MMWLWLWACAMPVPCEADGTTLDVSWRATWLAPSCASLPLQQTADAVEARLSIYADGSELHRVRDGVGEVAVSESTYALVRTALDLAGATQGAYDPTVGPLVLAWGVGIESVPVEPDADALAAALERVGFERVRTGRTDGQPWVDSEDRSLDLSSLLEGHLADALAGVLGGAGHGSFLVSVGDEHRAGGLSPEGDPWRVGVDGEPGAPGSDLAFELAVGGLASAHGRGKLLDPRSGAMVDSDVTLAVVRAPTATLADGLATAVVVSGAEAGLALLESRDDVEGLVLTSAGVRYTTGMPQ